MIIPKKPLPKYLNGAFVPPDLAVSTIWTTTGGYWCLIMIFRARTVSTMNGGRNSVHIVNASTLMTSPGWLKPSSLTHGGLPISMQLKTFAQIRNMNYSQRKWCGNLVWGWHATALVNMTLSRNIWLSSKTSTKRSFTGENTSYLAVLPRRILKAWKYGHQLSNCGTMSIVTRCTEILKLWARARASLKTFSSIRYGGLWNPI